jgi:KDO2-lipid IV(A) lauroyltransferase
MERAIDNISWCFPELSRPEAHRWAVEAYQNLFTLAIEIANTPRLIDYGTFFSHIELGDVQEGLDAMYSDRPTILITGHCGNWELMGYALAFLGLSMHTLYRPLDIPPLNDWLLRTRGRRGIVLIDKFGASTILPPILEAGKPVAFIADQNAGDKGLFVPFFDRLSSAYKTIGVLALKYDADIICGQAVRLDRTNDFTTPVDARADPEQRFRYRLDITDVIRPHEWTDQPDPLFYVTARYRQAIEDMVRAAPTQFLWLHRYWKSRPRHERLGRPFPGRLREKIEALPWMTPERVERIVERSARDAAEWADGRGRRR